MTDHVTASARIAQIEQDIARARASGKPTAALEAQRDGWKRTQAAQAGVLGRLFGGGP